MIKFLPTACALVALSSLASAQVAEDWKKAQEWTKGDIEAGSKRFDYTRHLPSGTKRTIEFFAAVNEDCGKADGYEIKVVQQPEHGTIDIVPGFGFAKWPKDARRAKCNDKRIPGVNLNYKPANGFLGTDEFEIFAMTPSGWAREVHYTIKVR